MHDPRIDQLAKQLVRYSTNLRRGEKVLIDLYDVPDEVGISLVREARRRGAVPFVTANSLRVARELLNGATDEQYRLLAKHRMAEMRDMDAYIAIRGSYNIAELSDVPAGRMDLAQGHLPHVGGAHSGAEGPYLIGASCQLPFDVS